MKSALKLLLLVNLSYLFAYTAYYLKQKNKFFIKNFIKLINTIYCIPPLVKRNETVDGIRWYKRYKKIGFCITEHNFFGIYICTMFYLFKFLFAINLDKYIKQDIISDMILFTLYLILVYFTLSVLYISRYIVLHKVCKKFIQSHVVFPRSTNTSSNNILDIPVDNRNLIYTILSSQGMRTITLVFILNQINIYSYTNLTLNGLLLFVMFYTNIRFNKMIFKV